MVKDSLNVGRSLGLPDGAFEQRRPNKGQITKREVRAVSLYSLGLRQDSVVWDIGAGAGSISVEAALIAHNGQVYAVERDNDSLPLLEANVAQLGSENIHIVFRGSPRCAGTVAQSRLGFRRRQRRQPIRNIGVLRIASQPGW